MSASALSLMNLRGVFGARLKKWKAFLYHSMFSLSLTIIFSAS